MNINHSFLSSPMKNSNSNNVSHDFSESTHSFNMLVAIRIRPLHYSEALVTPVKIIEVIDDKTLCLLKYDKNFEDPEEKSYFSFDFVFDESVEQQNFYKTSAKSMLNTLTNGYNISIFVYGATGTGKTYTMIGSNENPGIIYHVLQDLFFKLEDNLIFTDYAIKVSFIEVYNENIRDLLSKNEKSLEIWEDPIRGIIVVGVKEVPVSTTEEILEILKVGAHNRTKESNGINEASSRSHAIMQIVIEYKNKNQGIDEEVSIAKLNLIDLAGSERTSNLNFNTETAGKKKKQYESSKINQSLLVLTNCIQILSKQSEKSVKLHIPYRNSKLTRILKDTLGGNSRTLMIGNISSSLINFEETLNTLNYATQAKKIRTSVLKNVIKVSNHLANYSQIINGLKKENEALKKMLMTKNPNNESVSQKNIEEMKYNIQSHFSNELEMEKKIHDLDEKLKNLDEEYNKVLGREENEDQEEISSLIAEFNETYQKTIEKKVEFEKALWALQQKRSQFLNMIKDLTEDWKQCLLAFYQEKLLQNEYRRKKFVGIDLKDLEILCILNQIELRDKIIFSQNTLMNRDRKEIFQKQTFDLIEKNKNSIKNKSEILDNLYQNDKKFDYYRLKNIWKPEPYSNLLPTYPTQIKKSKRSLSYHVLKNFHDGGIKNQVFSKFVLPKIQIVKRNQSTSLHLSKEKIIKKNVDPKLSRFFQNSNSKQREKLQSLMNEKNYLKYKFGI